MRPVVVVLLALAACGSDTTSVGQSTSTVAVEATSAATSAAPAGEIVNTWVGTAVDPTALPLGDSHVSTAGAAVGDLFVCDGGDPNGPGAQAGPWINEAAGTWDSTQKVAVSGSVDWPMAQYSQTIEGASRVIASNGLPVGFVTGVFPIAADDPAYQYDRNPNSIAATALNVTLPLAPVLTGGTGCMPKGAIGVLKNGVAMYAPIDALNRDAAAYETLDVCDGHPQQQSQYHYHSIPACILDASVGPSTVVGFAYDGFPIVVERDATGALPTNADLDECHGRTSRIDLDGVLVEMYHYSATVEFPYFIGCFRGEPVA